MGRTAHRPSVVLYGAGMISRAHGAAAQCSDMRVVAVASRTPEHAAERAGEMDARPVTYDDVVARHIEADIAVVATPPHCHAHDAIALLDAGYAVVLEKPLCTTLADADAIVEASARHQGQLLYAENLAYAPVVQQLLARVPTLGQLTHVEVRALQGLPEWGGFTTDEWGGGALFDLGAHPVAVALLVANAAGLGVPVAVDASLRGGTAHGSDEYAEVHLHYSSGLIARVESSWQHGPAPVWDAQLASDTGVLRAELLPTPSLEHDGEPVALPTTTVPVPQIEQYGYLAQLRAAATSWEHGTTPTMSASFGRLVLDVVCAAYRSAGRDGEQELLPFSGARDRTPLQLWRGA
jgi:myo-inositol 2-dehydrogenase/D-chiro-inositol 1-dehydrogenase